MFHKKFVSGILLICMFNRNVLGDFQLKGSYIQPKQQIQNARSETHLIEFISNFETLTTTTIPEIFLKEQSSTSDHCTIGYFECKKYPQLCIPQVGMCDGKVDCPDNSDEIGCQNSHEDQFYNLLFPPRHDKDDETTTDDLCKYNVTTLLGNDIIEIPDTSNVDTIISEELNLYSIEGCQCIWEKFICQNLHFKDLSTIPMDVEYLDLSGSTIEILNFNSPPGFPYLRHLILSSCICGIKKDARGPFYKLDLLLTLHLTGNQLSKIPNGTFSTNVNLLKLFLSTNNITILEPAAFEGLSSLLELDLRDNRLVTTQNIFAPLQSLQILHLSHNKIEMIERNSYNVLKKLEILSLSFNQISFIERNAFENLTALKKLYLSWNKLRTLESKTFCNLHSLLDLRLDNNQLYAVDSEAFACLENLQSLNLMKNHFVELSKPQSIFQHLLNLQHIQFDHFWMCWWAPRVRSCQPKGDGISSDKNLLDNILLRTCVWIMGLVGVIGNFFVIVSRIVLREPNRIHSFYIKNLALADLLMGLFLLSVAVHDQKFRGTFVFNQYSWRNSITCQFSGLLGTWSSEASVLILTLITLDRYLSIVRPFADKGVSLTPAILIIGVLWFISFLLSYVPLSGLFENYFGHNFYTSNGLCLPLQIHNPFDSGWEYSFILFVIVNSIAFGFITYAYWEMLQIIHTSSLKLRSNQQKQDGILAKRFGLIVLTDFFCWAPVIVSKSLAMAGVSIQPEFYAWLAVFVLPVNSALNPIIYTLTTKIFIQQFSKATLGIRKRWTRRRASEDTSISLSLFNRARTQRQQTITTSIQTSLKNTKVGNNNQISRPTTHHGCNGPSSVAVGRNSASKNYPLPV